MGTLRNIIRQREKPAPYLPPKNVVEKKIHYGIDYTPYTLEELQAKKWKPFISISCDCSNIRDKYFDWVKTYVVVPHEFTGEFSILKSLYPGYSYVIYRCTKCGRTLGQLVEYAEDKSVWNYKAQWKWYKKHCGIA